MAIECDVEGSDAGAAESVHDRSVRDQLRALSDGFFRGAAEAERVCVRPLLTRVTDAVTGQLELVPIPCGSTRASQCPSCAERARRLRMAQCREGWHLEAEPTADRVDDDLEPEDRDDAATPEVRRSRSTRRRQD